MSRAKVRRSGRPSVSVRPLEAPDQIEVRTACKHTAFRTGWQLGPSIDERAAVAASVGHHALQQNCRCMTPLWAKYRVASAPADLGGMAQRFNALWDGIEREQAEKGYALLDWQAAQRFVMGVT
jgi:hypothetical protein